MSIPNTRFSRVLPNAYGGLSERTHAAADGSEYHPGRRQGAFP
jgi:hypothetical protein